MTKDTVTLVAIKAIDVLTENDPQHGDWGENLGFAKCCAKHHLSYSWWPSLHVYLTLVELCSETGYGEVIVRGGFDDLKIIWEEV
jgi:hypothetical protein